MPYPAPMQQDRFNAKAWRYGALGSELAGAVLGPVLLGLWLDSRYGWTPAATVVGALVGVCLMGLILVGLVMSQRRGGSMGGPEPKR